jgi:hypothetical protein
MYNENEKKPVNTNTYGGNYSNQETKEKLQIDYSNKLMTVKIMPITDDYRGDEKAGGKIAFSSATASTFLDELEDARTSFKNGEKFNSMVPCGVQTNNAIQVCDGKAIGRSYGIYIVIYVDIQPNKKTDQIYVYTVKSGLVVKDYDARTGEGTSAPKPFREIKDIIVNFDEFVKASNRAAAHAFRDADKYRNSALANATRIAGNAGATMYNNKPKSKPSGSIFEDEDDGGFDYNISEVLSGDFTAYN